MREIKFRGKRCDNSGWVYGDLRQENCGNKVIMTNLSTWGDNDDRVDPYGDNVIVNPNTIGQFTGLKDRNGKEIYDGDIIEINYKYEYQSLQGAIPDQDCFCVGVVTWMPDSLRFMIRLVKAEFPLNKELEDAESVYVPFEIFDFEEIKILGNIYDNPELMEGTK